MIGKRGEEWHQVEGWPGYQVSSFGRVLSKRWCRGSSRPRLLRQWLADGKYPTVTLHNYGKELTVGVHILVCTAFNGVGPSPKHEVAHWDGVTTNNVPGNLRWATHAENMADKKRHGTQQFGELAGGSKLTEAKVLKIRTLAKSGKSDRLLAAKFGVSKTTIVSIRVCRIWRGLLNGQGEIRHREYAV